MKRGYFLKTNNAFIQAIENGGFKPAKLWINNELIAFENVWINATGDIITIAKSYLHSFECLARFRPVENITSTNNAGYLITTIAKKTYLLHRIIASTFLERPADKFEINHVDGNKLNCNVTNLEWCSRKENMDHYYKNFYATKNN